MKKMIKIFIMLIISLSAINAGGVMPYGDLINSGMPDIIGGGQVPDLYQFLPVPKPKPVTTLAPLGSDSFTVPQIPQQEIAPTETTETPASAETTPPAVGVKAGKYPADLKLGDVPHKENYAYWLAVADNTPNKDISKEDADFISGSQGARGTIFQGDAANRRINPKDSVKIGKSKHDKITFLNNIAKKIPEAVHAADGEGFKNYLSPKDKTVWDAFVGNDPYEAMRMEGYLDAPKITKARNKQLADEAEAAKSEAEKLLSDSNIQSVKITESGPVPGAYEAAMEAYNKIVANNKEEFDRYNAAYEGLKTFREEQFGKEEKDYKKWADIYAGGEPESFTQEKRVVPEGVGMSPITGEASVLFKPTEKEPPMRDYPQRLPLPPVPQAAEGLSVTEANKKTYGGAANPNFKTLNMEYFDDAGVIQNKNYGAGLTVSEADKHLRNLGMADSVASANLGKLFTDDAKSGKVEWVVDKQGNKKKMRIIDAYVHYFDSYFNNAAITPYDAIMKPLLGYDANGNPYIKAEAISDMTRVTFPGHPTVNVPTSQIAEYKSKGKDPIAPIALAAGISGYENKDVKVEPVYKMNVIGKLMNVLGSIVDEFNQQNQGAINKNSKARNGYYDPSLDEIRGIERAQIASDIWGIKSGLLRPY